MLIKVKNNNTLLFDKFEFKCSTGINGTTRKKVEGDKKTPKGNFSLDCLF